MHKENKNNIFLNLIHILDFQDASNYIYQALFVLRVKPPGAGCAKAG
jgi:hypothetical protein